MATRPFDDAEDEAWVGFLRTHRTVVGELGRRLAREQGMALSSFDVLANLAPFRDGLRMSELAERVVITTGGLTRLADRLEAEGLIERRPSPDDGRSSRAALTPAGRRALRSAGAAHRAAVRELFLDRLSPAQLDALAGAWRAVGAAEPEPRGGAER